MLPTIEREPRRSRYSSATWYPALGLVVLRRRREPPEVLRSVTVPVASSNATLVSPRSTLTSTCFFNLYSVLYLFGVRRAIVGGAALRQRPPRAWRGADEVSSCPVRVSRALGEMLRSGRSELMRREPSPCPRPPSGPGRRSTATARWR